MAERASERLLRMLGMITYLDRHAGVPVGEIAEHFAVSPGQVLSDVDTLWMTGTPGYFPHDLIDFDAASYEQGVVRLTESRGMTQPLRLGTREAVVLVAALRAMSAALGNSVDVERARVLTSALHKLTTATGEAAATIDVRLAVDGSPAVVTAIGTALQSGRRLRLRYVNASDVASERDVDPARLVTDDERSYLLGWCYRAGAERIFRLDRVLRAEVLDDAVEAHPAGALSVEYRPDPTGGLVTLHLSSRGRWIAESVPVEDVRNLPDGTFEVDLRIADEAWLRHLLLQAAEEVLAIRPPSVAADVAAVARAALAAYGPLAGDAPGSADPSAQG